MKHSSFVLCFFSATLLVFSLATSAQENTKNQTPFDSYIRVSEKFFVYDQSLVSPYVGPDVSHWELLIPHEIQQPHDSEMTFYDRKRLGVVTLSPGLKAYVDLIGDPMTEYYEFRDIQTGKLIHKFAYYGLLNGALLVNGQGAIYQYHTPKDMCFGNETKKFVVKTNKFVEVPQPIAYWENTGTATIEDVTLYFERRESSPVVATLMKRTSVKVLGYKDRWFLIKTPLGLTGWIPFTVNRFSNIGGRKDIIPAPTLDNTVCN